MAAVVYILLKYAAYTGWCYAGLEYTGARRARVIAPLLGFVRQLIGIVATPLAIYFLYFPLMQESLEPPLPVVYYFLIFLPLRSVEWYLMLLIIRSILKRRGEMPELGALQHVWVAGGVLLSILTDIPILFLMKSFNR
jgi:hypothetical protein